MDNEARRIEISSMMMQMGQSLIAEGTKLKDYSISQAGNVLVALSGVILSDEDVFLFSQYCLMFTAKKILDQSKGYDDIEAIRNVMREKGLLNDKKPRKPRGPNKKESND